ncbi:hypothetical protein BTA51_29185, partial [Hahella sp. CCB-MM4]
MSQKTLLVSIASFLAAAVLALLTALFLVSLVENRTASELREAFAEANMGWTRVEVNGLTATLTGTAPTESARIRALQVAGEVIDASRLSEEIVVPVRTA